MNKKILLMFGMILLGLPMILATDSPVEALDLYYLLVENVFGNLIFAGLALAVGFFLIGVATRMSQISIFCLVGSFLMVFGIGSFGAIVGVPILLYALWYFFTALIKTLNKTN